MKNVLFKSVATMAICGITIMLIVIPTSCDKNPVIDKGKDSLSVDETEKIVYKGSLKFSISSQNLKDVKKSTSVEAISYIAFAVQDKNQVILLDTTLLLANLSDGYESAGVDFKVGTYKLVKYWVLNSAKKIVYALPLSGSTVAALVTQPSPIEFVIKKDEMMKLAPEAVRVSETTISDFGIGDVASIEPVPVIIITPATIAIQIAPVEYNYDTKVNDLTTASLTVTSNGSELSKVQLEAKTNTIDIPNSLQTYTLTVEKANYVKWTKTYTLAEIQSIINTPLQVLLSMDLTIGLKAYYPFNGNANDESGNGHDGNVNGATLCADRLGNGNNAYQFDGVSNNITIDPSSFYFENFTYCLWLNPTSLPANNSGSVMIDIGGDNGDQVLGLNNKLSGYSHGFTFGGYSVSTVAIAFVGSLPESNKWYYVSISRSNDSVKLYIDGASVANATTNNLLPYYNKNASSSFKIGSRHSDDQNFTGIIDEVRVYNRVLSSKEIKALSSK